MTVVQDLYWLSISFWVELKVLVLTYKALVGLGPANLSRLPLPP